jgi:hypothetical protein
VNFAAFNTAFVSLMGGSQLSASNMAAYTAFVNTILFLPNPNENLDRVTLPTSAQAPGIAAGNPTQGLIDYMTVKESLPGPKTCNGCHIANPGPGSNRAIEPFQVPQPLKTPQIRNAYQKQLFTRFSPTTIDGFGMDHDGKSSNFTDFFKGSVFDGYSLTQKSDIAAYMMFFDTGAAPAVGFAETLTSSNVANSTFQSNWATLQTRAAAGDIDLIARGTVNGIVRGLLYQPASQNYITNTSILYTQAQLEALIQAGDTLTFMGVYPGTGTSSAR